MVEKNRVMLGLALLAVAVAGCHSSAGAGWRADGAPKAAAVSETADGLMMADFDVEVGQAAVLTNVGGTMGDPLPVAPDGDPSEAGTPRPETRQLIYRGRFSVAVGNVELALDAARRAAEEMGGYVQAVSDDTITLRVPADRWEDSLGRLRTLGRVLSRKIEVQDVTEEIVDLRLRLRNSRALLDRLEQLLARAQTVKETLEVETQMTRVRTEVERLEGRLQWLSSRVALATLVVRFVPAADAPVRAQALPFAWLRELGLEPLLGLPGGAR